MSPGPPAMDGRARRLRHWRASLGSMLNENHDLAQTANSVMGGDFVYVPNVPLPASKNALKFLEHKFGSPPRSAQQALRATPTDPQPHFRRAMTQPQMMVHYDRDPLYRERMIEMMENQMGPEKPPMDPRDPGWSRQLRQMEAYGRSLVPQGVSPLATPLPAATPISRAGTQPLPTGAARANSQTSGRGGPSSRAGPIDHNRQRRYTPGPEAAGFKPYTPFSDDLLDGEKVDAKYIPPEHEDIAEKLKVPRYYDAYRSVLGLPSGGKPADVLRVHGKPEYPAKVMADVDVPNYVAWAAIYPYCPLTQLDSHAKPVHVPPRGFTPATPIASPSKVKDMEKIKRDVIGLVVNGVVEGISPPPVPVIEKIAEKSKRDKENVIAGIKPATPFDTGFGHQRSSRAGSVRDAKSRLGRLHLRNSSASPSSQRRPVSRPRSMMSDVSLDVGVSRRVLDLKAPDVWYTGRTPDHTPTPDYTLPFKPCDAWTKHYSPQRVRHFLNAAAADAAPQVI